MCAYVTTSQVPCSAHSCGSLMMGMYATNDILECNTICVTPHKYSTNNCGSTQPSDYTKPCCYLFIYYYHHFGYLAILCNCMPTLP